MAEPVCRSLDQPPADCDGPRVFVRDQNWKQGETNDGLTEAMFVKRWRLVGQADWNVPPPPKTQDYLKSEPTPPGASDSGLQGFDFSGLFPTGRTLMDVEWEVFGSTRSRYLVQGDTDYSQPGSYDKREWAQVPARFTVTVSKAAPVPPPPPPVGQTFEQLRDHAKTDLAQAEKIVTDSGRKPRSAAPRVYWAHRLLTDPNARAAFLALDRVWPT